MLWRFYRRSASLAAMLFAVCILFTACGDTAASQTSEASTAISVSSSSDTTVFEPVVETQEPEAATTQNSEASSEPPLVTSDPTEDTGSGVTESLPAPETMEPQDMTTAVTTTEATTTVTTITQPDTKPPQSAAPVIIPEVKTVSCPGTAAESADNAVLDYSNASLGYIGAKYTGGSARAKLRIICGDVTYDHDLAVGGVTEYFPLSQGSGDYSVQIYEQIEGRNYAPVFKEPAKFRADIGDEIAMYLYPNRYVDFDKSSDCVRKGAELCAGVDGTVEKLAAIFGYITDNITYDYDLAATVKSGYVPCPDEVLARGSGICFDYASLFAAMARSQGIPTRLVIGYATDIYHAWNEVYTEETGWIAAEVLLSRNGYNLVDSTFYAGASDKVAMAEYITNSANYSAVFRY